MEGILSKKVLHTGLNHLAITGLYYLRQTGSSNRAIEYCAQFLILAPGFGVHIIQNSTSSAKDFQIISGLVKNSLG